MNGHKLKLRYVGYIQQFTGKKEEEIYASQDLTLRELLNSLINKYGNVFEYYILNAEGWIRGDIMILMDGVDIDRKEGLDTELNGNDIDLVVTPMIEGG